MKITPKQLHKWYLEAIEDLNPDNYNPKANKPYEELSYEQRFIDIHIANCINYEINKEENKYLDKILKKLEEMERSGEESKVTK